MDSRIRRVTQNVIEIRFSDMGGDQKILLFQLGNSFNTRRRNEKPDKLKYLDITFRSSDE
jgi:hypothetical protein